MKIALCGGGQIGAALYSVVADSEAVVAEICWAHVGAALNQVQGSDMFCETGLRFFRALPQVLRGRQPHIPFEHMRSVF